MAATRGAAWFYLGEDGGQQGPIEADHLAELCADGHVSLDTPVYASILSEWSQLSDVKGLLWMAKHATPAEASTVWFVLDANGTNEGPLSALQLRERLGSGDLSVESAVWSKVLGEWTRICDTPALRAVWQGD